MSDGKCIVKYLRLSLEDEDMLDESNSITNQRIVIGQYIASKNEFKNTEVLEFKDDGYSGTNFDRPGFQSMMELVRDGKVSTIIVKDLSRFGRNHIEVDTYLEQIFPFVVEGTHEAIVSKEVFDAVQEKLELNSRKRSKTHNNNYPLKGLVKCGGCGQNLQHVTRCNPHFKCPRKFNAANQDCVTDNLYDDEFNEMIFRAIKLFAKISDDAEPVLELQKAELKSKVNGAAKKIRDAKDSISRYKHQKTELYMRYAMEEISEEEFTRKNDKLDKQIEKETLAIAQMETEQSEAAERLFELPPDGRQCLTDLIEGNKQLTREIAVTFIRGIKVYNDKRIEIEWNFADELVKYVEQVQKICS